MSGGLVGLLREAMLMTRNILNTGKECPREREERKRTKGDKGEHFALRYKAASSCWHLEKELCLEFVIKDLFTFKF